MVMFIVEMTGIPALNVCHNLLVSLQNILTVSKNMLVRNWTLKDTLDGL